jgi:hypothetical protein
MAQLYDRSQMLSIALKRTNFTSLRSRKHELMLEYIGLKRDANKLTAEAVVSKLKFQSVKFVEFVVRKGGT